MDETTDIGLGIRTACDQCGWKSQSYSYDTPGEQAANDELAEHYRAEHPAPRLGWPLEIDE